MPFVVIFPRDHPDEAVFASFAAQAEAGFARVVQKRRRLRDRKAGASARKRLSTPANRAGQRRQAIPLPVSPRIVITP